MILHDRLYGELRLPALARKLAHTCPVLLRLREVRMANIPFVSYPGFANVSRYEHSLGAAHLAWRFAERSELSVSDGTALALAALYHDGATPAFGHLYEELLARNGFDHEQALVELLTRSLVTSTKQVFLGRRCRLPEELPRTSDSSLLSCEGIATILSGQHALSEVIAGDIDVDNIDNVIRAATAMGVAGRTVVHPHEVVDSLALDGGRLCQTADGQAAMNGWMEVRHRLYGSILANAYEFRAQTATKWAIEQAALSDPELLQPDSWVLTEPELTFEKLRSHAASRELIDGVRMGAPPKLLFSADVPDVSALMGSGGGAVIRSISEELSLMTGGGVYVNFYLDKGPRTPRLPISAQRSSLFGDSRRSGANHDRTGSRSAAGVVGAVSTSTELRRTGVRRSRSASLVREFGDVLASGLGVNFSELSPSAWDRGNETLNQISLFR